MMVTLEEMKNYLRVDDDEDDGLITTLLASAERMCMDILRTDEESGLQEAENGKAAVSIPWPICMNTGRKLTTMPWS